MAEKLARTRAKRGGNRSVMTELSKEANDLLEFEPINKQRLDFIASSLNEKLNLVKTLDEEIIENCAVDEIEAEILESDEINSRVMDLLRLINEATTPKDSNAGISTVPTTINVSETTSSCTYANKNAPSGFQQSTTPSGSSGTSTLAFENAHIQLPGSLIHGGIQSFDAPLTSHAGDMQSSDSPATGNVSQSLTTFRMNANLMSGQPKAKLPKLALPKFRGELTQWQNFWDSYNSAIHVKQHLSLIDKFNHLHSLLEGQAARAIQGLTRTEANYNSAIEILQKRFGKPQNMISIHMDEMLKIPSCVRHNASQVRLVYDKISVNVRGLESLGVSSNQYGSLLIPVILSKLPHEIRVQIARNTAREVWDMSELLEVIRQEVEALEISEGVKTNVNPQRINSKPQRTPTANALLSQDGTQTHPLKCL